MERIGIADNAMKNDSIERFSDRVDNYVKYRPDYPREILEFIKEYCGLTRDSVLADVGCGPGTSSRLFLEYGCRVIGVEPNAAMRSAAFRQLSAFPFFRLVDGTSSSTTLADHSVDIAVAAQAFHWFDADRTRSEFLRILKPEGSVVLMWNIRQLDSTPFLREFELFLQRFSRDYQTVRHENITDAEIDEFFGNKAVSRSFPNTLEFDLDGLMGRVLSSSYMPTMKDAVFPEMYEHLESLFAKHAENGRIKVFYDTRVYISPARSMAVTHGSSPQKRTITVAHSPDSDDAFMFYGLATNKLETDGLKFEHTLKDIQSLNEDARNGVYDVTAISFHAFAYVSDKYVLLPHGASIGDNYGPILVTREPRDLADIPSMKIAVPGELTSAFLALRLFNPDFSYVVVPFDKIIDAVLKGEVDAGLLIHEGQLFYNQHGLNKLLDLGEWWHEKTGLPLPMGGNVIRRDLGVDLMKRVSRHLHESIVYSMKNREDALTYALQFARDMKPELADRFVAMWVNDLTLDYGERGREAVRRFLGEAYKNGLIPTEVNVEFVG